MTLRKELYRALSHYHIIRPSQADTLTEQCPSGEHCVRHLSHSYKAARSFLFGQLHLQRDREGYYIKGVYCNHKFRNSDFPQGKGLGENQIPSSFVINAEHTWPQSKFNKTLEISLQKSDLHALFPTSREANTLRSNLDFQEIDKVEDAVCEESAKGSHEQKSGDYFEPPQEHKGNVARALFYFAVRYNLNIVDHVENTLRFWHLSDPVDEEERTRHEKVFVFQQVRNPFIDYQQLVSFIEDF